MEGAKVRIKKLTAEYESRVSDCDKMIQSYSSQIRKERQQPGATLYSVGELIAERRVQDSKRQLYVQFIKDIESLID